MGIDRLYVCDGDADDCAKTYCKHAGNGECAHTTQRAHALYPPPRRWVHRWEFESTGRNIYVEQERS